MVGWYNRVYRVSCEPAHISDLPEYMPAARGAISIVSLQNPSIVRSLIALDFGLQIVLDILRSLCEVFDDLKVDLSELRRKFDAVRKINSYGES